MSKILYAPVLVKDIHVGDVLLEPMDIFAHDTTGGTYTIVILKKVPDLCKPKHGRYICIDYLVHAQSEHLRLFRS